MSIPLSDLNSCITCLHAPHGWQYSAFGEYIATALIFCSPAATALPIAFLSAHIVHPKLAFSKLHPVYMLPFSVKTQAPTANFEYGEYDFSEASFALLISS